MAPGEYYTSYTTTDYTITSTAADAVWYRWVDSGTSTATATWQKWSWYYWTEQPTGTVSSPEYQSRYGYGYREPTAEELARRQAEQEAREARIRQAEQERLKVEARAEALLRSHLNAEQLAQLEAKRYFELELISNKTKKRYRIHRGRTQNIVQLDEKGKPIHRFCVHSADWVPDADNMLLQKLMIEYEEERFLRVANRSAA